MSLCDVPVISTVCEVAGEATAVVISAPFDFFASAIGQAAGWLIEAMWSVFDTTTMVDLTADGYVGVYNLVFGVGVFLVVLFFCLQLITGLLKRDPTALARAATGAAKSVLGSFIVVTLAALALEIVDQLCTGIIQAAGETTGSLGDKIILMSAGLVGLNIAAPGVGAVVTIFLAGLMISAVAIVWFSLLIRKALLLVGIILAPIAFSGATWDVTKGWIGKWAAFVIALIVSKLVLVVIFLTATTLVATPIEVDLAAVTEPITGTVLMGIAAFSPYMVYRFIAFLGFDLYNQMGMEQDAKAATNRPIPTPSRPQQSEPKKVVDGDSPKDGSSGSPPAPKTTPPSTPPAGADAGTTATGSGAAAAAAPVAAVVVGAQAVKQVASAGNQAGKALGAEADQAADAAGQTDGEPRRSASSTSPAAPPPQAPSVPEPVVPPRPPELKE